jgi:hypothetical protein
MKKNWGKSALLASLCAVSFEHSFAADTTPALDGLTANDLLQLLVKEGVVSPEKIKELGDKIKTRERKQSDAAVEPVAVEQRDEKPEVPAGVVRVPYIPTYVRDEIRDQVRVGLKEDVTKDVLAQAKTERWGIPGVSPAWVERIKFYGDMRLRVHGDRFGSSNEQFTYPNLNGVNSAGTSTPTENYTNFYNTTEDRYRLRARFRLGVQAKITNTIEAGGRIVTGNQSDPGSANQTVGTYNAKYPTDFDLAYLNYRSVDKSLFLTGGRIKNPFVSTDLIWHPDLTFEGLAGTWWLLRSDDLDDEFRHFDPFIMAGAFPLQEINESSQDKWLYAAQLGFNYTFLSQSKISLALAYYDYNNVRGKLNQDIDTPNKLDFTAPAYFQKGNTVFNIANTQLNPTAARYALASDFHLANVLLSYDYAGLSPLHVVTTADYVKNIGFDHGSVSELVGEDVTPKTEGYELKVAVGWPEVQKRYDWQLSLAYKYLERDAVIDAFTDSDFHLGGTDGKGYTLRFDYGLADDVALGVRWISTDEIDGVLAGYPLSNGTGQKTPLAVDTLLIDINAKF